MPEVNYNQVMTEIKSLNLSDQLRLLEEMATLIRKKRKQSQAPEYFGVKRKRQGYLEGT